MKRISKARALGPWIVFAVGCSGASVPDPGGSLPDPRLTTPSVEEVDNGFESDDPNPQSMAGRGSGYGGSSADAGSASPPSSESSEDSKGGGAERAVSEADVIKVDGNRLYALSRYGGLAIVDITNPDAMRLLGRKRINGIPFEMYVEGGKAFVMLNDFGRWVSSEKGYGSWQTSSEILAFDVTNPSAIAEVSHFDVTGEIADSRLVGNVAYVVTYENGYCWGCDTGTRATRVASFRVDGTIRKVDQIAFSSSDPSTYSWKRSVSSTNQRMYIGGPEYRWNSSKGSVIQVVDISDPNGTLKKGADIDVAGNIHNRWQMDEFDGVLRVVTQPQSGGWGNSTNNPKVQTFKVTSATQVSPLGSTELVLPEPESLRSVRFDGARGYAITARQTDPLYTIDLSNPASPKQAAELKMPGWIFHMEPRGDRLIGFGYESTDWSSPLAVSLFDVSDLAAPSMLSRVTFGSGWSMTAEDQDRIHKSVRILDDAGLILVPFASYGRWENGTCEAGKSGIQLIDYAASGLTLKGLAPQQGMPRRAFVANGRLVAMSDRHVSSFDISSRAKPTKTGELDLANPAYRLAELPHHIASITNDWWTGEAMLSLTPKTSLDDASAIGKLSLSVVASEQECGHSSSWTDWYRARIFVVGRTQLAVVVPVYRYFYGGGSSGQSGELIAASINIENPANPVLVSKVSSPFLTLGAEAWGWTNGFLDGYAYRGYYGGLVGSGEAIVQLGSKLAYLESVREPSDDSSSTGEVGNDSGYRRKLKTTRVLHVLDFSNAAGPRTERVLMPESLGATPLQTFQGKLVTTRWKRSVKNPAKVRFFLDRVDLSGALPKVLSSLNIPGSLVSSDDASNHLVTLDYRATRTPAKSWGMCAWPQMLDYDTQECVHFNRDLRLSSVTGSTVTSQQTLPLPDRSLAGLLPADDRIYVSVSPTYQYCNGCTPQKDPGGLLAIGGIRAGKLAVVSEISGDAQWALAAHGSKVAVYTHSGMSVYDTTTSTPSLLTSVNLRGWGSTSHVLLGEHTAVCALGEWGMQSVTF
jgi:hypothetical protein